MPLSLFSSSHLCSAISDQHFPTITIISIIRVKFTSDLNYTHWEIVHHGASWINDKGRPVLNWILIKHNNCCYSEWMTSTVPEVTRKNRQSKTETFNRGFHKEHKSNISDIFFTKLESRCLWIIKLPPVGIELSTDHQWFTSLMPNMLVTSMLILYKNVRFVLFQKPPADIWTDSEFWCRPWIFVIAWNKRQLVKLNWL